MNLKGLAANSYTVPDGDLAGVCFALVPYKLGLADTVAIQLRRIEPPFEYVHTDGRRQMDEPAELTAERLKVEKQRERFYENAAKLKREPDAKKLALLVVKSDWTEVRLWNALHDTFCVVESITTDVIVPDANTSAEAQGLRVYWQNRPKTVPERWELFQYTLGVAVYNAWWVAYVETRAKEAPAPPELGQEAPDDPFLEASTS